MSKYKKMKQLIADMRLPEYRYKQLLDAVFLQGIMRFEDMKLLPKTLREKLVEQFGETVVEIKAILNCTPFVRQYGILFRKWGVFVCQREYHKKYSGEYQ